MPPPACRPGCANRAAASRSRPARVPIVPGAILFDLLNGGDKDWGRFPPYRELGYDGGGKIAGADFALGSAGAGLGATTVNLKGGLGSASAHDARRHDRRRDRRRQRGRQRDRRRRPAFLGGAVRAATASSAGAAGPPRSRPMRWRSASRAASRENTTIALVATDATLTKAQAKRLAVMAQTRPVARDLSGAHAARRRHRVRRGDRQSRCPIRSIR